MGKSKKKVLLIAIIIFALLLLVGYASFFPLLVMRPTATGQIQNTNIVAVRDGMNTIYFINTGDGFIMIDAGSNTRRVEKALESVNINIYDVKWILLTHSDSDHVASLNLFPNAIIYMNEDELQLINGTMNRNRSGGNSLPDGIDINNIILLSDNQELSFNGTKVRAIKAPGHTPGSMLYMVDGRYLFTGDAFMIRNRNISVHPFTMDSELSEKTIDRLRDTVNNSKIVLTSHYGIHR